MYKLYVVIQNWLLVRHERLIHVSCLATSYKVCTRGMLTRQLITAPLIKISGAVMLERVWFQWIEVAPT